MEIELEYLLERGAFKPVFAYEDDACFDLRTPFPFKLYGFERRLITTGVRFSIPEGYYIQLSPRSGLAAKYGLMIVNSPGIVDCGYTGEVKIIVFNCSDVILTFDRGDRIAQGMMKKKENYKLVEVSGIKVSEREASGIGSTGVK